MSSLLLQPAASSETTAIHPQTQSLLFRLLPPELRRIIWKYAVLASNDTLNPYHPNTHWYRPPSGGTTHYTIIDAHCLLRTCRAIYDEARWLAATENWFRIWKGPSRGPVRLRDVAALRPHIRGVWLQRRYPMLRLVDDSRELPPAPPHLVRRLHFFTQQYWLESWITEKSRFLPRYENLEHLMVTIRRSDWWMWETDEELGIDPRKEGRTLATSMREMWSADDFRIKGRTGSSGQSFSLDRFQAKSWGRMVCSFPRLKSFTLELETCKEKRTELEQIVDRASRWQFPLADPLGCGPAQIMSTSLALSDSADSPAETHSMSQPVLMMMQDMLPPSWTTWDGPACMRSASQHSDGIVSPELVLATLVYLRKASSPSTAI